MRFAVDRLDHLVLNVRDVEIAAAWYQRVLGMEVETYGRVPAHAGTHNHQRAWLRESLQPLRQATTAAAYGSRRAPGRRK